MNKARRKVIEDLKARLEEIKSELEFVQEQEQEAFDNLPESLQGAERGQQMETYIDNMAYAVSNIEDAMDSLELDL